MPGNDSLQQGTVVVVFGATERAGLDERPTTTPTANTAISEHETATTTINPRRFEIPTRPACQATRSMCTCADRQLCARRRVDPPSLEVGHQRALMGLARRQSKVVTHLLEQS